MASTLDPEAKGGWMTALWASPARRLACVASVLWSVVLTGYAFGFVAVASMARGTVMIDTLFFLVVLVLPLILIWVTALLVDELARQREMVLALAKLLPMLSADLSATRATLATEGPVSPGDLRRAVESALREAPPSELAEPLGRLLSAQENLHADVRALFERVSPRAAGTTARPAARGRQAGPARAAARREPEAVDVVPVEAPMADANRPAWPDLIRALDFPRDADDAEGFRALKIALRHGGVAQCLQAAEDVLTLLSQADVYMDDLSLQPADAPAWRRYLAGLRGAEIAGAGAIADPAVLAAGRGLIDADPIFRDTALHFQRRFDAVLTEFGTGAEDAQLLALTDTRTGRAFMLLARLNGAFG